MKNLFIIFLFWIFAFFGYSQTVEFDVKSKDKLFYPVPYLYNDASLDINFYNEMVYAYNADGMLKEEPFKADAASKINYKVRTLLTDNIIIDLKTDTRYVLFPEYYGLSGKEDKRISGCGSILVEKLGTKGTEVNHVLFDDPDCENYQKGAYFLSNTDSYITQDEDIVYLVSMKKVSKSVTNPAKPGKGILENCVKRIVLNPSTNKVDVSVHLINKVPACEEEYTSARFIGSIENKLYFAYTYTIPKTKQITVDVWSVDLTTSLEAKEFSYQLEMPKGASPAIGRMEVVSDPAKSGIAFYFGFGVWEGKNRVANYKVLEIHEKSDFKLTDFAIPDEIMTFGIAPPKLSYYDAGELRHFFVINEKDLLTVDCLGSDQLEMHVEKDVNLLITSPSSAALFFDERLSSLKAEYLKPIFENPESICKECKVFKSGLYRLTGGGNEATIVAIEFLKTCPTCEVQQMRARIVTRKLK